LKEQERLDRKREEKMKQCNDAIGQHRIEETLSEVNSSFVTDTERKGSQKRHQMKNHRSSII